MATLAALVNVPVTTDFQEFNCRGAIGMEVTIANGSVVLSFAYRLGDMKVTGAYGPDEFHVPKLLNLSDEPVDSVRFKRGSTLGEVPRISITAFA